MTSPVIHPLPAPAANGNNAVTDMEVAVLFARRNSVYKQLPGCDVYDIDRDARNFAGSAPVVAHPPCRAWGRLRRQANPRPDEKELAIFAVEMIRKNGGVLEHPEASTLWPAAGLPEPGARDAWGGHTLCVNQSWWGHKAEKRTRLYIVGVEPKELPAIPLTMHEPSHIVAQSGRRKDGTRRPRRRPELTKAAREETPPDFAAWLCELARRAKPSGFNIKNQVGYYRGKSNGKCDK